MSAARGVITKMDIMPKSTEPQAEKACMVSPLRMPRPEMMNMPVVVTVCRPALAACTPPAGATHLHWRDCTHLLACLAWSFGCHVLFPPRHLP